VELIRTIDTTDYTFSFEQNPGVTEGDILVSSFDGGYLRRVTAINQEGDDIIVETEFASITEAIQNADIDYSVALTVDEKALKKAYLKEGVIIDHDLLKDSDQTNLNFNLDFIIYDADGNPNTTSDQIKLTGNFGTSTTFSPKVKIKDFNLEELIFTYNIKKEKKLHVSCFLAAIILNKEEKIASIPFHDIVIPAGIPITVQPVLELNAGIVFEHGGNVQMEIEETIEYVTSISYQNGDWTTTKTVEEYGDYTPPSLAANLKVEAYIKPKLLFKIYRVLSPKVEAKLYQTLEAETRAIDWELSKGFEAGLGVEMKIWKHTIFDFTANVIDIKQVVAEGTIGGGEPPTPAFTANPTSGTAPLTVNFTDQSTNDPTSWLWDFGDGTTSTQQNPTKTYDSEGTYNITLTVSNTYGSNTLTKDNYITVTNGSGNTPPTALFTVSPTSGTTSTNFAFDASGSTDNETPTSQLQVRWDFDGNGSWDTNWDTDKTQSHQYSSEATYTAKLEVKDTEGLTDQYTRSITVSNGGGGFNDVFNPATGQTWMDRNLGASRVAQSSTDEQAYGDLYQWGRLTDGHEKRNSGTTSTLSNSDTPGHGNFITVNSSPYDWRSPQNNNLWQGVSGTNNPCPAGYRLPTEAEWEAERQSWSSNNAVGAFNSPLKLPVAGFRNYSFGSLYNVGSSGFYRSATVGGSYARDLNFSSSNAYMNLYYRAHGRSVRCLKD
jgi:uncharacterized protein (TIGR02145 family)